MNATITKDFEFAASHQLEGLPEEHPCSRLHGHNYVVRVSVTGTVQEVGFVVDYRDLSWIKTFLDERFDHRHLNDVIDRNPTAENLAGLLLEHVGERLVMSYDNITHLAVGVSETPKTWATVGARVERDAHDTGAG